MICGGCKKEFRPGDAYIEGRSTEFIGKEADPFMDNLIGKILGQRDDGLVAYCTDCTDRGGPFEVKVFEEDA